MGAAPCTVYLVEVYRRGDWHPVTFIDNEIALRSTDATVFLDKQRAEYARTVVWHKREDLHFSDVRLVRRVDRGNAKARNG